MKADVSNSPQLVQPMACLQRLELLMEAHEMLFAGDWYALRRRPACSSQTTGMLCASEACAYAIRIVRVCHPHCARMPSILWAYAFRIVGGCELRSDACKVAGVALSMRGGIPMGWCI